MMTESEIRHLLQEEEQRKGELTQRIKEAIQDSDAHEYFDLCDDREIVEAKIELLIKILQ